MLFKKAIFISLALSFTAANSVMATETVELPAPKLHFDGCQILDKDAGGYMLEVSHHVTPTAEYPAGSAYIILAHGTNGWSSQASFASVAGWGMIGRSDFDEIEDPASIDFLFPNGYKKTFDKITCQ